MNTSIAEASALLREKLFSRAELARAIGVHIETRQNWAAADPSFPRPLLIRGRPRYRYGEVRDWLDRQPRGGAGHASE
jgi:hypothetical protein